MNEKFLFKMGVKFAVFLSMHIDDDPILFVQ